MFKPPNMFELVALYDAIMDESHDAYENKEKAKLILAQIHDKIHTK